MRNRQWILASHAADEMNKGIWRLAESDMPAPGSGQILIKTLWLSVDPYMRGKLNSDAGMRVGDLMQGGGVGTVIESRHPDWKPGDLAEGLEVGWQEYAVLTPDRPGALKVNKIDTSMAPPQAALSWL